MSRHSNCSRPRSGHHHHHRHRHRKHPKPRLFIALNSFIILVLLLFLVLQGLALHPLPSVSFLHILVPDHTRRYIYTQTGINAYEYYTTFFATCFSTVSAPGSPATDINCKWHSLYFNWTHFFGIPDILNDVKLSSTGTEFSPEYVNSIEASFQSSLTFHKAISIATAVFLIITIAARFIVIKACIFFYKVRCKKIKRQDLEASGILEETARQCDKKDGVRFFSVYRIFFITAHSLAVSAGFLLAPACLVRSSFHIFRNFYGTELHQATENTFNVGLHVLLWLVAFFSILDIRAARAYSLELAGIKTHFDGPEELETPPRPTLRVTAEIPQTSTLNICPLCKNPIVDHNVSTCAGGKIQINSNTSSNLVQPDFESLSNTTEDSKPRNITQCKCHSSRSSTDALDFEYCILNNPLFDPFKSDTFDYGLAESSAMGSGSVPGPSSDFKSASSTDTPHFWSHDEKYKNPELFKPGSRDAEFSDEEDDRTSTSSESLTPISRTSSIRTAVSISNNSHPDSGPSSPRTPLDRHRLRYDRAHHLSRRNSLGSLYSLSNVSGTTYVGSLRSAFSETSSILSDVPSLISDTSSQHTSSTRSSNYSYQSSPLIGEDSDDGDSDDGGPPDGLGIHRHRSNRLHPVTDIEHLDLDIPLTPVHHYDNHTDETHLQPGPFPHRFPQHNFHNHNGAGCS